MHDKEGIAHKKLDERFEMLDSKLRTTFLEVEKRFSEMKMQPEVLEDRLQELEDLILLMQLEIMKIKEKTGTQTEFLTTKAPDLGSRLDRLEEMVAGRHIHHEGHEEKEGEPLFEKPKMTGRMVEEDEDEEEEGQEEDQKDHDQEEDRQEEEPIAAKTKNLLKEVEEILAR